MKKLTKTQVPKTVLMKTLYRALSVRRAAGTKEEAEFVTWMALTYKATMIDEAGNIHFDRRKNGERSLFTAHSDTCSKREGANTILIDGRYWRASGDVLGADDGAGCALLAHMMHKGVPGYFIIFRGEETGGIGSKWLADYMPEVLKQFDRAIAFDRAGEYDVITHQAGSRCCSDEFAEALADQLSQEESGLLFMPSDGGVYTDTAEFTSLVSECSNVSVGYARQHSTDEYQDVMFLQALADALVLIDWESLPVKRDPARVESKWQNSNWAGYWKTSTKEVEEYPEMSLVALGLYELLLETTSSLSPVAKADLSKTLSALVGYNVTVKEVSGAVYVAMETAIDDLLSGADEKVVASNLAEVLK